MKFLLNSIHIFQIAGILMTNTNPNAAPPFVQPPCSI
jgi:hypothetical protein